MWTTMFKEKHLLRGIYLEGNVLVIDVSVRIKFN